MASTDDRPTLYRVSPVIFVSPSAGGGYRVNSESFDFPKSPSSGNAGGAFLFLGFFKNSVVLGKSGMWGFFPGRKGVTTGWGTIFDNLTSLQKIFEQNRRNIHFGSNVSIDKLV